MMQEWAEGAYPNFLNAGEQFAQPFDENGLEDIGAAIRQRLNDELGEQSYQLACDGIEAVREAVARHRGDPPLNGAGMDSVREMVRLMGNPNAEVDWNAVFEQ